MNDDEMNELADTFDGGPEHIGSIIPRVWHNLGLKNAALLSLCITRINGKGRWRIRVKRNEKAYLLAKGS